MQTFIKILIWTGCVIGVVALASIWWVLPLDGAGSTNDIRFLGRFHPVLLHMPIGLIVLLALLELRGKREPGSEADSFVRFVLLFTVLTTLLAVISGSLLAFGEGADEALVESHQRNGILLGMVVLLMVGLRTLPSPWAYRGGLLVAVGLLFLTSHQGGSITHGRDYLTKHAPDPVRRVLGLPVEEPVQVAKAEDLIVFEHLVQPIIEQNCLSCHNSDKLKGELNLESFEGHLAGGELGPAVVPSDLEASELYFRITLPQQDEEFMPPDDKTPLSDSEVGLLAWWIERGASPDQTVAQLGPRPDEVEEYVAAMFAEMLSPEECARIATELEELYAALGYIRAEYGVLILPTALESNRFTIETNAVRKAFDDEVLRLLEPYAESFVAADLSGTQLTDAALDSLAKFSNLRTLNLSQTGLVGSKLGQLAQLPELESLNLYGTAIEAKALAELAELKQLKQLFLFQTALDDSEMIDRLQAALPDCEIKVAAIVAPLAEPAAEEPDYGNS